MVYLVNTGWIGGSADSGAKRISIKNTRAMITSILERSIEKSEFKTEPIFGLSCPQSLMGVNSKVLNPRTSWENPEDYDSQAVKLVELFTNNFKTYGNAVAYLEDAGPVKNQKEIVI